MKIDFPELLEMLKSEILALAKRTLTDRVKEAHDDAEYILNFTRDNLENWTAALQKGTISREDFEYHIKSQKDLLTLVNLKRKGISKIRLDKFREDVFFIIISGVLEAAGI